MDCVRADGHFALPSVFLPALQLRADSPCDVLSKEVTAWREKYLFISSSETNAEQDKAFAEADRDNNGELSFEASEIKKNSVLCAAAQPTDNSCVVCAPQEFHGPAEEVFKTHFPDQPLDQEDVKKWFNATQEDSSQKLTKVLWRSCRLTKWQLADDGHCCAGTVPRLHEFRLLEQAVR